VKALKSLALLAVIVIGLTIGGLVLSTLFVWTVCAIEWPDPMGEHRDFGTCAMIVGILLGVGLGFRLWVSIDRRYFDGNGLRELRKSAGKGE
jgi:hypothetical protein